MAEPTCIHAVPQAADQLHGICIFCYRDRLGAARAENAALRKAALEVFYNSVTNCECTTVRESDMIALGEVLGVYGVQEKPAENGAGGA